MKNIEVFNIRVNPLYRSEFLSIVQLNLKNGYHTVQNGINAASIIEIIKNKKLENAINNSDLVNIDGMSVVWALNFLGHPVPERVACPDLADDILKLAEKNGYSVFLFGAREQSLELCKQRLQTLFPGLIIAGSTNGYFKEDEEPKIVEMINSSGSDILLLGMPSPRKEFFAEKYRHVLNAKFIFGVGGYFDILSGQKKRAPKWMQRIGMEWFYRFCQEPNRMWRRYLIGNVNFIWQVLKEKVRRLKH